MHALRKIHAALVPGGLLVDTQPVSARPPVCTRGRRLGTLDMREWRTTIEAVDAHLANTLREGLYVVEDEERFVVTDEYDNGLELVETVRGWRGTRISDALGKRIAAAASPLTVHQEVRLRVLRALDGPGDEAQVVGPLRPQLQPGAHSRVGTAEGDRVRRGEGAGRLSAREDHREGSMPPRG